MIQWEGEAARLLPSRAADCESIDMRGSVTNSRKIREQNRALSSR
jgi:hypothetical protein